MVRRGDVVERGGEGQPLLYKNTNKQVSYFLQFDLLNFFFVWLEKPSSCVLSPPTSHLKFPFCLTPRPTFPLSNHNHTLPPFPPSLLPIYNPSATTMRGNQVLARAPPLPDFLGLTVSHFKTLLHAAAFWVKEADRKQPFSMTCLLFLQGVH